MLKLAYLFKEKATYNKRSRGVINNYIYRKAKSHTHLDNTYITERAARSYIRIIPNRRWKENSCSLPAARAGTAGAVQVRLRAELSGLF